MNVFRFAARTALASYFVVNGAKAFLNPEPLVADAEPVADKLLTQLTNVLPASAAAYLPENTKGLVRGIGAAQAIGGAMLATGIGRRLGAALLTATMIPSVAAANPLDKSNAGPQALTSFLTNVALMGGVGLAAQDTEGRPTLAWQAKTKAQLLSKQAESTRLQLE